MTTRRVWALYTIRPLTGEERVLVEHEHLTCGMILERSDGKLHRCTQAPTHDVRYPMRENGEVRWTGKKACPRCVDEVLKRSVSHPPARRGGHDGME